MSESKKPRVVVVGAGHGGANVVALLRQKGYDGEIVLVGEENVHPYHRPPLSKAYLKGQVPLEELWIKPTEFYGEQDINTRLGERVTAIRPETHEVELGDGERLDYTALVLATGAAPRVLPLPGTDLDGVFSLRDKLHADSLGGRIGRGHRVVIVGGGYIGLEVAASTQFLGGSAVVLEREDRALARVASPQLADYLVGHHRSHGNQIVTSARVTGLAGEAGGVRAVLLEDGRRFEADTVLIGAGAVPRDDLAASAGLRCTAGIEVDLAARTSIPDVYAVGDVTCRPLPGMTGHFRLESIPSAVEQAKQAVSTILGLPAPKPEVPWFWSDQFDAKVKIAGLVRDIEDTIVRGDPAEGHFGIFHLRDNRVVAAECVNSNADFMAAKKFIQSSAPVDAALLVDPSVSLREVAA
ncbi:ferredoxin reductase [Nocardioides sp. Soil797]|nr:ferredoxin reductase [Nocardioides sp. Soil797]